MVSISIWLFGKPEWEISDKMDITKSQTFKDLGNELKARMDEKGEIIDKLVADGWNLELCLYDIHACRDGLKTIDVENHLKGLGIDPDMVSVNEFYNEDWDEDEEDDDEDLDDEEDD